MAAFAVNKKSFADTVAFFAEMPSLLKVFVHMMLLINSWLLRYIWSMVNSRNSLELLDVSGLFTMSAAVSDKFSKVEFNFSMLFDIEFY